jgi:geranylgeranyl diphosphate synthase type II
MATEGATDLGPWILTRRREIEAVLESRLPAQAPGDDPGRLVEAMRYSLLAPGKRLRPLLALAAAEAVGDGRAPTDASDPLVLMAAASVELVHCYSLIHDDLPAMDDDDFRRGRPSNHKTFGEATAILAGDALLTLAFEWLAEAGERRGSSAHGLGRAALALARGAGPHGMVRGQARDLGEPPPVTLDGLERLHSEKTAALFRAAVEVGAAAAGAGPRDLEILGSFGHTYGLAFQHADDLEDRDHASHAGQARDRLWALDAEASHALDRLRRPERARVLRAMAAQLAARARATTESAPIDR